MSKRSHHNCLDVGDRVRVKMANGKPGETLYEIVTKTKRGFGCTIREVGTAPNGKPYAPQLYDTSLLILEPSNEKLAAAFNASMGGKSPFRFVAGKRK